MVFETFPPQESTQSSEVIGWSDSILAHDSLRTNPFPLLRTFPCKKPGITCTIWVHRWLEQEKFVDFLFSSCKSNPSKS